MVEGALNHQRPWRRVREPREASQLSGGLREGRLTISSPLGWVSRGVPWEYTDLQVTSAVYWLVGLGPQVEKLFGLVSDSLIRPSHASSAIAMTDPFAAPSTVGSNGSSAQWSLSSSSAGAGPAAAATGRATAAGGGTRATFGTAGVAHGTSGSVSVAQRILEDSGQRMQLQRRGKPQNLRDRRCAEQMNQL